MPFDDDPPSTPASQALRAWHATLIEATRSGVRPGVRPGQGVFTQAMPPLAASARVHDFRAAEWEVVNIAGEIHAQEQDYWSARAYFSPEQTHCALLFAGDIVCIDAFGLGNIHDHWVYDTQTRTAQCIVPDDAQAWEKPRAKIVGEDLVIYASREDMRAGREARRVRL